MIGVFGRGKGGETVLEGWRKKKNRCVTVRARLENEAWNGLFPPKPADSRSFPATRGFLLPRQVKSFIETQKALLAEIQNGCKRNFILAKEKEEKEQKLQQSASMAEITVTEALEEGSAEDGRDGAAASVPEEGEETGETPTASENGNAEPAEDEGDNGGDVMDSDSDTDEEETKDSSERPKRCGSADGATAPRPPLSPEKPRDRPPPLRVAEESQRDAGAGNPGVSPTAVPSPGKERRISVSSPGRGHKIFVVTRVESLPERTADAARPREDVGAAAKPLEPQNPAPTPNPELPTPRVNGALPESITGTETPPVAPNAGSDPQRGDAAAAATACESAARDAPLPNGLKTDFARALPEVTADGDGKMGTCAAEHGESAGTETPTRVPRPPQH